MIGVQVSSVLIVFLSFFTIYLQSEAPYETLRKGIVLSISCLVLSSIHYAWILSLGYLDVIVAIVTSTVSLFLPLFLVILIRPTENLKPIWIISGWLSVEYIHLHSDLGFPWLLIGNILSEWPNLIQWYEITGVLGESLWILICVSIFSALLCKKRDSQDNIYLSWMLIFLFCLPLFISTYLIDHHSSTKNKDSVTILVAHTCVEQKINLEDWMLKIKLHLSLDSSSQILIVFPEVAMGEDMWWLRDWKSKKYTLIRELVSTDPRVQLLIGTHMLFPHPEGKHYSHIVQSKYHKYNGVLLFSTSCSDSLQFIGKNKFIPFQEAIPSYLSFVPYESQNYGYTDNHSVQLHFSSGQPLDVMICYESLFGEYIGQEKSREAQLLFHLSGESFFHGEYEKRQYMNITQLRAIETRTPIIRATNCGYSGLISPSGYDHHIVSESTDGALIRIQVPLSDQLTFYEKNGDWVGRLMIGIWMILMFGTIISKIYSFWKAKQDS